MQRLPKRRGFKSKQVKPEVIKLSDLSKIKGTVDNMSVYEAGLVSNPYVLVKLIGNGSVSGKHTVNLQFATKTAVEALAKAGGSFTVIAQIPRPAKKSD